MLMSQMMRSGHKRRAISAPARPSSASSVSNPFLRNAQTVVWRKMASSSMTRILGMGKVGTAPWTESVVYGGEEFFGRERLEEKTGMREVPGQFFVLTQSTGGQDANVGIEAAQGADGGGAIQDRHHHGGHHPLHCF